MFDLTNNVFKCVISLSGGGVVWKKCRVPESAEALLPCKRQLLHVRIGKKRERKKEKREKKGKREKENGLALSHPFFKILYAKICGHIF